MEAFVRRGEDFAARPEESDAMLRNLGLISGENRDQYWLCSSITSRPTLFASKSRDTAFWHGISI